MTRPNIGDLIIFHENGVPHLAIITSHNNDGTANIHVFTTSHSKVHASQYSHLTPEQLEKKKS